MKQLKILVVDDEDRMRKLVRDFLVRKQYEVVEASNGEEAVDVFVESNDIDLIILDVMMPKMDGWEACREIRKISKVPIIMLTAKSEESDELLGFELGVDEYISKPFSPRILVARVDAILRRTNNIGQDQIEQAGDIEINKAAHIVTVKGEPIELSFKEFELLSYFIQNKGIALSRENILNNVWNYDYFGDARTIDTHVKKLRMVLQEMFRRARQSRLIPYDPAELLELPTYHEGKRRSITEDERKAILAVAEHHRAGLWVLTLLYTGMRPGETAALTWSDVDFERNEIHVHTAR